jgi:hypothetical protein
MSDQVPPWDNDPLSNHLSDAEHNTRAASLEWPDVYEVQQRAHALLLRLGEALESEQSDAQHIGAPRMLIHRSHSAILATMRLAMSGQTVEAQAVLRVAIEQAWYALHIASDPAPPARAKTWWNRDDSPDATRACQNEFKVGTVRGTHERVDPEAAASMKRLYDDAISLGAHPNPGGVMSALFIEASDSETTTLGVGILHPEPVLVLSTIKAAVDVVMGLTETVSLIYEEAFQRAGLAQEFNALREHAAEVFRARAEVLRRERAHSARARPE